MRNLASIQKIVSINPIEGADKIEVARVLGWDVVVKKNDFKPEDLCVYIEIDSVLPNKPEFSFLIQYTAECFNCQSRWKTNCTPGSRAYCSNCGGLSEEIQELPEHKLQKMLRIKSRRMRGQLSQGIVFPLSICPQDKLILGEDTDVTELLGIEKYEAPKVEPSTAGGRNRRVNTANRPSYVPLTDETRVQILLPVIEEYQGTVGYISEKLDGSSFSASWNRGKFEVCSRNKNLLLPGMRWLRIFLNWFYRMVHKGELVRHPERVDAWWVVANELNLKEKMETFCKERNLESLVCQGEIAGPRIQGNKYKLDKVKLFVFQFFNPETNTYFDFPDFIMIAEELKLDTVPILDYNYTLKGTSDDLLEMAKGKSVINPNVHREGIVFRPHKDIIDTSSLARKLHRGRVSFKMVNNDFLLKYGDG